MFLGTFSPRLDEKGRLVLPAKWREELSGGLVISRGHERCLRIDASTEFARIAESLREDTPRTAKADRDYNRMLFAAAHDEIPDKQGRVTVPTTLREYAGLDRECTLLGLQAYIEMWDAASWTAYQASQEEAYSSLSEGATPPAL